MLKCKNFKISRALSSKIALFRPLHCLYCKFITNLQNSIAAGELQLAWDTNLTMTEVMTSPVPEAPGAGPPPASNELPQEPKKKLKPGAPGKYRQVQLPTAEMIAQEDFMNNCAVRTVLSAGMGSLLGLAFGVFMGTMDTSVSWKSCVSNLSGCRLVARL